MGQWKHYQIKEQSAEDFKEIDCRYRTRDPLGITEKAIQAVVTLLPGIALSCFVFYALSILSQVRLQVFVNYARPLTYGAKDWLRY